ncbi:MAG: acyl-CoA dehydrogenase family protein [Xanthomonadales bacterium]|jgi:alkylation response protein AidB-like acyl-CoA dehydrogenase|nr:acyl-CoA dehydrogenase family protein [Xanthomonadales bacterium]
MDFAWNEDQLAIREAAAEFGARMLVDGVEARDREGVFSRAAWDACADFGLPGLLVPGTWGGGEQDLLTAVASYEGVGRGGLDNGTIFAVAAHAASCAGPIMDYGSDAQKDSWLPRLADGSIIGAAAITEPGSGSNALGLATSAGKTEDGWVLNGSKTFVSNAPMADLFLVYARTGPGGLAGLTAFLVPADTAGLSVGQPIEKMGLRTAPMAEVFFDDCRIPADAVLGSAGSGSMIFNQTMEVERLLVMAPAIGVMERLLERCVSHARERDTGKGPIGANQAVSHPIADMELDLEQARWMLYRAAWHAEHHGTATRESALAKLSVSEAYIRCCRTALQIFGGYGYTVEYGIERELRDALATTVYVGTSEIQRNLVAGLRGLK